jgi:hypothetical protein
VIRCPDCNKFVSFDQQEPEIEAEIDDTQVTGSVRLVLACAECGGELKEANIDFQEDIDHECEAKPKEDEEQFTLENESGESSDRYQATMVNKKGKVIPIKPRYQKHFYGADLSFEVKCNCCGKTITVTSSVEEQASGFDEL